MKKFNAGSMTLAVLAVIASGSGCELSENAKKSADNSGRAADNSEKVVQLSNDAYGDGRQGAARDRREKALEALIQAKTLNAKVVAASAYFNAMEFQLYKENGFREDTPEKRQRLFADAVSELMKVQKDFWVEVIPAPVAIIPAAVPAAATAPVGTIETPAPVTSPPTTLPAPVNPTVTTQTFLKPTDEFIALAAALHKVSERQLEATGRYHFEKKSMLDLISEALIVKTQVEEDMNGLNDKPAYFYEVLREAQDAVMLLQVRANFMAGSAAQILSKTLAASDKGVALKATSVQLKDATDRLKFAASTKGTLKAAGAALVLDPKVKAGLSKWSGAVAAISAASPGPELQPKVSKANELKTLVDSVLAE